MSPLDFDFAKFVLTTVVNNLTNSTQSFGAGKRGRTTTELFVGTSTFLIIIFMTIAGNSLVILSIFTYKPLNKVQNYFLVSLAAADLCVAALVMPFHVVKFWLGRWALGATLCQLWLTWDILCCTASILNLCAIALDRYWAITSPISYSSRRTLKFVLGMIAALWALSLLISVPPLVGWNDWSSLSILEKDCQLTEQTGFVVFSASGSFFVPLIVMTIVYVKIFAAARQRLRSKRYHSLRQYSGGLRTNESDPKRRKRLQRLAGFPRETGLTGLWRNSRHLLRTESSMTFRKRTASILGRKRLTSVPTAPPSDENKWESPMGRKGTKIYDQHRKKSAQESPLISGFQNGKEISTTKRKLTDLSEGNPLEMDPKCQSAAKSRPSNTSSTQKNSAASNNNNNFHANQGQNDPDDILKRPSLPVIIKPLAAMYGGQGFHGQHQRPLGTTSSHQPSANLRRMIKDRERISVSREKKAAKTLAIIMGVFVLCWLPFFLLYILKPFCRRCSLHPKVEEVITWLGYINSALNPIIYTIFNMDFRHAFQRILCYWNTKQQSR